MRITHATYKQNGKDLTVLHASQSCASDSRIIHGLGSQIQNIKISPRAYSARLDHPRTDSYDHQSNLGRCWYLRSNFKTVSDQC